MSAVRAEPLTLQLDAARQRRDGEVDGAPAIFRMRWENIERDSLDWSWQRSDDDGETWTSLWEIEYSRVL